MNQSDSDLGIPFVNPAEHVRLDRSLMGYPGEGLGPAESAVGGEARRQEAKGSLGTLDNGARGARFRLTDRATGLHATITVWSRSIRSLMAQAKKAWPFRGD